MLTVQIVIALAAFLVTIVAAIDKCPLWVSNVLLCVFLLVLVLPIK